MRLFHLSALALSAALSLRRSPTRRRATPVREETFKLGEDLGQTLDDAAKQADGAVLERLSAMGIIARYQMAQRAAAMAPTIVLDAAPSSRKRGTTSETTTSRMTKSISPARHPSGSRG